MEQKHSFKLTDLIPLKGYLDYTRRNHEFIHDTTHYASGYITLGLAAYNLLTTSAAVGYGVYKGIESLIN